MGVIAIFTKVVAPLAVVAVFSCGAVPNRVSGLELFAKAAAMGEWGGLG